MSGPKHLWSGDWQQESTAVPEDLSERRPKPPNSEPTVTPAPRRRSVRPRRAGAIALAALLVLAAGAWGLASLLDSSANPPKTTAAQSPLPQTPTPPSFPPTATIPSVPPTPTAPSVPPTATAPSVTPAPAASAALPRPVYWLGMEIQTVPPGAAVIETVGARSPAGLGPGDVIVEINSRPVNGTRDIALAIRGHRAGDVVSMQVGHGSGLYGTDVTLAAPPSFFP